MIVTIDGPAGAGKSSAARALAERLGFDFLDTGAMYRAVTLAALRGGTNRDNEEELSRLVAGVRLEMPAGRVVLNGEDVSGPIRTAEVTAASRQIADSPAVRRRLVELQRRIAAGRDVVCEGRDQGTIVFPNAACKFFLVADPEERARRRHREMLERGEPADLDAILAAQRRRDADDAARDLAPMVPAPDAIRLDSSGLTLDEVVGLMEAEVRRCSTSPPPSSTASPT
jgi:cytidylate kinase